MHTSPRAPLTRAAALVAALALAGLAGCGTSGGSSAASLEAWERSRAPLLLEVVVPSLDGMLRKVEGLAQKGASPFRAEDLRTMLLAQAELPPEAAGALDLGQPVAFVIVAGQAKADPHQVVALGAKAGAADRLLAALGEVRDRRGETVELKQADGHRLFARRRGDAFALAPSAEALDVAADIALGARRALPDDVVVAAYPPAVGRWQGVDPSQGLAEVKRRALEQYIAGQRAQGRPDPPPAERASVEAVFDVLMRPLSESRAVELGFVCDSERGLRLDFRLRPRPGTSFARQVGTPAPYELDPRLLAGEPPAAVGAVGPSPFFMSIYGDVLAAQGRARVRGAAEVARLYGKVLEHLSGAYSARLSLARGRLGYDLVFGLKRGASGPAALEALTALLEGPSLKDLLVDVYGKRGPAVKVTRRDRRVRIDVALGPASSRQPDGAAFMRALTGSTDVAFVAAASNDRLVVVTEPDAEARLDRLLGPAPASTPQPSADLAAALEATRGRDSFGYVDLWAFFRPVVAMFAGEAQAQLLGFIPGLAGLKLPLVFSHRGGDVLTGEVSIPLVTLTSVAGVSRALGGAGVLAPR